MTTLRTIHYCGSYVDRAKTAGLDSNLAFLVGNTVCFDTLSAQCQLQKYIGEHTGDNEGSSPAVRLQHALGIIPAANKIGNSLSLY